MPNSLRLICFDLDDTLWPCQPVIREAEEALFRWLQQHAPAITAAHDVDSLRTHRMMLLSQRPELGHDLTALRLTHLEMLMDEFGVDIALARKATDHFRAARNKVAPFSDVAGVLQRLGQDYLLVSLTNGNAQVEQTPLSGCFDHNLTAADVGAAKPDPAMFHAACDWAGVLPQQALHVGDDPARDVAAAGTVGMRTAWLNRDKRAWPAELPVPDLQLSDLTELLAFLTSPPEEQHA